MSNPGDRWRRAWIAPALLLVLLLGLGVARCSTWEKAPGAQPFSSATVAETDATFAIERPDATGRLLILRGNVTDKTARGIREAAAQIKASAGTNEPQWEIDDQLEVKDGGISIADPLGALQSALLPGAPSALRVNSQYGAELTGTAPDEDTRTIFGDAVQAALGSGSIKNSLTVAAADSVANTEATDTEPVADTTVETAAAPTTVAPPTTIPATTIPATTIPATTIPPTTIAVATEEQAAEVLKTIELKGVTFASGSADLTGDSNAILDEAAQVLGDNPGVNVEIGGHTDNRGDANFNRDLSQRRADTVKAYLVGKGIAADRMTTKGYGPDKPIADNATNAGRQTNRRIEFTPAS